LARLQAIQLGEVMQALRKRGIIRAEGRLPDPEGLLKERLGLGIAALGSIRGRE
jgi:hypothetical protein